MKSTPWKIIILSRGQVSSQGTTTLKMHKFIRRPYFSYPRKWSKSFFIKSKSVPTMPTLLILQLLQSPAFPLQASTQYLNNKRIVPTTTTILLTDSTIYHKSPSLWDNLWQSALLHYNRNILLLTSLVVSL